MKEDNDSDFMGKYSHLLRAMKIEIQKTCPESEVLMRYFNKKLTTEEQQAFEEHLDLCPVCLEVWQHLQTARSMDEETIRLPENWQEIENTMDERIYTYLKSVDASEAQNVSKVPKPSSFLSRFKLFIERALNQTLLPPRLAYVVLVLSFGTGALYTYAIFSRPAYFSIAQIQPEKRGFLRSESLQSESLRLGLQFFEQGKYTKSIEQLSTYLQGHSNDYQANYYLGLTYLFNAKKHLLGLPYHFDAINVKTGIQHLEKALSLVDENAFYQEDCLWYLGKANLMLGDLAKAKSYFVQIMTLAQPNLMRKDEASKMVQQIDELAQNSNN